MCIQSKSVYDSSVELKEFAWMVVFKLNRKMLHESNNERWFFIFFILLLVLKSIENNHICESLLVPCCRDWTCNPVSCLTQISPRWRFLSKFSVGFFFLRLSILVSGQRFLLLSEMLFLFFSRMVRPPNLLPTATAMRLKHVFIPALSSRLSCLFVVFFSSL